MFFPDGAVRAALHSMKLSPNKSWSCGFPELSVVPGQEGRNGRKAWHGTERIGNQVCVTALFSLRLDVETARNSSDLRLREDLIHKHEEKK